MSSTHSVSCRVAAFNRDDGQVVYVLFETTFESNVDPQVPHESAVVMGSIERVMKTIFSSAAGCEGGGLKGKSGDIRPESYLERWFDALKHPVGINKEQLVKLSIGSFYGIPEEKAAPALQALRKAGENEIADQLETGKVVQVPLASKAVEILYCSVELRLAAWHLKLGFPFGEVREDLAYDPEAAPSSLAVPTIVATSHDRDSIFVLNEQGESIKAGAQYHGIAQFVQSLWENELKHPKSSRTLIRRFREACEKAPALSDSAVMRIGSREECSNSFQQAQLRNMADMLGVSMPGESPMAALTQAITHHPGGNVSYWFRYLAEVGLIQIYLPNGSADLLAPPPEVVMPKPCAGLVVVYGDKQYRLNHALGPRKGWSVTRLSDGMELRMKAAQVKEVCEELGLKAAAEARSAIAKAIPLETMQMQQCTLF